MRILIIFNLLILFSVVNGNLPNKLYGGDVVSIRRRPYQVSIQIKDWHICNGIIISDRHILTAASCVSADQNVFYGNLKILIGTNNLQKGGIIHEVGHVVFHEQYNPHNFWINDIAILVTVSYINLKKKLKPIAFCKKTSFTNKYLLVGWGIDPTTNDMIKYLQQVDVKSIKPREKCQELYYQEILFHPGQYCLLTKLKYSQITLGSGGSPIISGSVLVGIISTIPTQFRYPAIYTRIYHYVEWINQYIK